MRSEDTFGQLPIVLKYDKLFNELSFFPLSLGIQKGKGLEEGYRISDMSLGQQLRLPLFTS